MEQHQRELLAARVVSGTVRLRAGGVALVVRPFSREARYAAEEAYQEALEEALMADSYTQGELLDFLLREGLWDDARQGELDQLARDIEEFKTKLVGLVFRSVERKAGKKALALARARQGELLGQRHAYDHLTTSAVASAARTRHLVWSALTYLDGRPVPCPGEHEGAGPLIEEAVEAYVRGRPDDASLRELARTDPWRSAWAARQAAGSVFGVPAVDLTDEQIRLQVWSQMYESVQQHPECPPDEVIDDDDIFDGWLILQRRKREGAQREARAEAALGNEKIRGSEEVFIVADTAEDARAVHDMNDAASRQLKARREAEIARRGKVQHQDLADVRAAYQMEAAKALKGRNAGG